VPSLPLARAEATSLFTRESSSSRPKITVAPLGTAADAAAAEEEEEEPLPPSSSSSSSWCLPPPPREALREELRLPPFALLPPLPLLRLLFFPPTGSTGVITPRRSARTA
jgi:hypothetical protein